MTAPSRSPLAVVLAGGLGTRLRQTLPGLPKVLAPVAGRPFLEWLLRFLRGQGMDRIVLSTGHLAEMVEGVVAALQLPGLALACVRETAPLGTAGGFVNAFRVSDGGDTCTLACNGDSLVLTDLHTLLGALDDPTTDAAILAVHMDDAARFGTVRMDSENTLHGFNEKQPGAGLVNAGLYLFRSSAIAGFPQRMPSSFEYDVFPTLIAGGARIAVIACDAPFLDIGTAASLAQADAFIGANMRWFQ